MKLFIIVCVLYRFISTPCHINDIYNKENMLHGWVSFVYGQNYANKNGFITNLWYSPFLLIFQQVKHNISQLKHHSYRSRKSDSSSCSIIAIFQDSIIILLLNVFALICFWERRASWHLVWKCDGSGLSDRPAFT